MPDPIIDRDAIIEKAAKALVEHDADRMTCYDHMGACCPADGCAHGFTSRTSHQAASVLLSIADGLLAPIEALLASEYGRIACDHTCSMIEVRGAARLHEALHTAVAAIRKAVGA